MKKYLMHVISGTHWDREWRHTAEQSKPRLVDLVDRMMDTLEKRPDYKCYCLDGGMVVIEDYLTIRPENKDRLKKLIQSGRVQLVNWYTLPETFTVAPEAIIRNVHLGQKMAAEFGKAMASGYTATGYGQTSQLPQIYAGFGIQNAIFYRGTNKYYPPKPLYWWEGIDGTRILGLRTFDEVTRTNWFFYVHQPLVVNKAPRDLSYTYETSHFPTHTCDALLYERGLRLLRETPQFSQDPIALKKAVQMIVEQAKPYAIGRHLLALNMEDNDTPFELLPDMIRALNEVSDEVEFVQNSIDEYMKTILADQDLAALPIHRGELRCPAVEEGFNGLLGATHSSRVKLKILNEQSETSLIHLAEPLAAVAAVFGYEYPKTYLDRAWKYLLLNHAHDSICGAAVDQAHEDMLYNFSVATHCGYETAARSMANLALEINTAKVFRPGDQTIIIYNSLPYARKKVIQVAIDLPKGAGGEGFRDPCTGVGSNNKGDIEYFDIVDADGNSVCYELLTKENIQIGVERFLDTNGIRMAATRRKALVEVEVPAMGYTTYAVRPRARKYIPQPETGPDRPLLARENGVLENEWLKVQINSNGTFNLLHKPSGHKMEQMHYFTDKGEVGNAHLAAEPQSNSTQTSLGAHAEITMVESNTLRGIYRIDLTLNIPAGATLDGKYRLSELKPLPITVWLTVEKGLPYLKIKTRLNNQCRDHKLQVNFPSAIYTDEVWVESAFAVEKRGIRHTITGDNFEPFYAFQPMQNFVDISNGKIGIAVLNKGLREYEIRDDKQRTIAITLLRTHRAYMTANNNMTPDELEKYPGQQSLGVLEYHYALYPHTGGWDIGGVLQQAYDHKVPLLALQTVPNEQGRLPHQASFISIQPADKVMLSALKQSDDGKGLIVRLWNSSSQMIKTELKTVLPVVSAQLTKLDETPLSTLAVHDGKMMFDCGPHKIITLKLVTP